MERLGKYTGTDLEERVAQLCHEIIDFNDDYKNNFNGASIEDLRRLFAKFEEGNFIHRMGELEGELEVANQDADLEDRDAISKVMWQFRAWRFMLEGVGEAIREKMASLK